LIVLATQQTDSQQMTNNMNIHQTFPTYYVSADYS